MANNKRKINGIRVRRIFRDFIKNTQIYNKFYHSIIDFNTAIKKS